MTEHGGHIDKGLLETPPDLCRGNWVSLVHKETPYSLIASGVVLEAGRQSAGGLFRGCGFESHKGDAMKDKREGPCLRGPCRMPRRCWKFVTCFLYGEGVEMVPGATVTDTSHSEREVSGSIPDAPTNTGV